jgi:hypothetical protein
METYRARHSVAIWIAMATTGLASFDDTVALATGGDNVSARVADPVASDVVLAPIGPGLWAIETRGEIIYYTRGKAGAKFGSSDIAVAENRCVGEGSAGLTRGGVADGNINFAVEIPERAGSAWMFMPVSRVIGDDHATVVIVRGDRRTSFVETTIGFRERDDVTMHKREIRTATRIGDCPASMKPGDVVQLQSEAVKDASYQGAAPEPLFVPK